MVSEAFDMEAHSRRRTKETTHLNPENVRLEDIEKHVESEFSEAHTLTELAWLLEEKVALEKMPIEEKETLAHTAEQLHRGIVPDVGKDSSTLSEAILRIGASKRLAEGMYAVPEMRTVAEGIEFPVHRIGSLGREVVICPGSFTGPKNLENFAVAFAMHGSSVTVPEVAVPSRKLLKDGPVRSTHIIEAYSKTIEAAIERIDEGTTDQTEKIDLVGFSTGAAAVVEAALRFPEKIRRVVLLNPIGVESLDSPYVVRMVRLLKGSGQHGRMLQESGLLSEPKYAKFANWVDRQRVRGFGELVQILHTAAKIDLTPLIEELIKKGVGVDVVVTEDDKLFRAEEVERNVLDIPNCGFVVLTGPHTKIGKDPEALAALVTDILREEK